MNKLNEKFTIKDIEFDDETLAMVEAHPERKLYKDLNTFVIVLIDRALEMGRNVQ